MLQQFNTDQDNEWLGILLQRYTLLLLGVCMKYLKNEEEARDSVQQIFLKVIQELQKYKVDYFKSWLYMVAKNHCLMQIRERQGKQIVEITDRTQLINEEKDKKQLQEEDLTMELMAESLNELNLEQQQCVTLFYLQKMSYQEITEATGFTLLQVKSYIQNGKRNLKLLIEKKLSQKTGDHYLTRFSYTPETWARMVKKPEDRRAAAKQCIESVGGKLHGFWYAFGNHDGYNLWEAPDNVSMAATVIAIGAGGALSSVQTTVLVTVEETLAALKKASSIAYRPPGK